jgi:lipopolysaccharide transport system ATP-binding protein
LNPLIDISGVSKSYSLERSPLKRLWRGLSGHQTCNYVHWALRDINLQITSGQSLGLIGQNGAGKSTLLQILNGVLQPTEGTCLVKGRVAALLELGAGFNPEMTGRENIYLNGPLLGLTAYETKKCLPEVVAFAELGPFIDQPIKTYSSGMFVRLAFSLVTSVQPDILIIDEALSVGDAEFQRKSFDRIMQLRHQGTTIFFCSHSLYQVEALCDRVIWLDQGRIAADGLPADVVVAYSKTSQAVSRVSASQSSGRYSPPTGAARLTQITLLSPASALLKSRIDDLCLQINLTSDPKLPCPHVAVMIYDSQSLVVASLSTLNDGQQPIRDDLGHAFLKLTFPRFPLLKGLYRIDVVLLCERGILFLDAAQGAAHFEVIQDDLEIGIVSLGHNWTGTLSLEGS